MFDFVTFRQEILTCYKDKKASGLLANTLENPSPANLRTEALNLYHKTMNNEDLIVFKEFFNSRDILETAISKCDLAKFRPLQNFINGQTTNPDEILVKLLAVYIDFTPRPYHIWRQKNQKRANIETSALTEQQDEGFISYDISNEKKYKTASTKKTIALALGSISLIGMGYFSNTIMKGDNCVYWNGEQYIQVDCAEENKQYEIIKTDYSRIENFKKITRSDTLTSNDHHKIWYSKINGKVEFFTESGFHPIHRQKPLKPATWYMIKKYKKK